MIPLKHHSDEITSVSKTLDLKNKSMLIFYDLWEPKSPGPSLPDFICLTSSPITYPTFHFEPHRTPLHWPFHLPGRLFPKLPPSSLYGNFTITVTLCWPKFQSPVLRLHILLPCRLFLLSPTYHTVCFICIWYVYCSTSSLNINPEVRIFVCLVNTVYLRSVGVCFL